MSSSNRTSINPNELSNPRSSRFGYQNLENEETTVVPRLSISDDVLRVVRIEVRNKPKEEPKVEQEDAPVVLRENLQNAVIHTKMHHFAKQVLSEFQLHLKLYSLVLNNEFITLENISPIVDDLKSKWPEEFEKLKIDSEKNLSTIVQKIKSHCTQSTLKKNAEILSSLITNFSVNDKKILIEASASIFKAYETQILKSYVEDHGNDEAIEILACEVVKKILSACLNEKPSNLTFHLIKKAVIEESTESKFLKKTITVLDLPLLTDTVKIEDSNGKFNSIKGSRIFNQVGIVSLGREDPPRFYKTKISNTQKCGYRLLFENEETPGFAQEEENKFINYDYKLINDTFIPDSTTIIHLIQKNIMDLLNDKFTGDIKNLKDVKDYALKLILPMLAIRSDFTQVPKTPTMTDNVLSKIEITPLQTESAHNLYCFEIQKPISNFTGRDSYLTKIKELLTKENVLVINGKAGTGKTELSKKYAEVYQKDYDNMIYITSQTEKDIEDSFKDLATDIDIPTSINSKERDFKDILKDISLSFEEEKTLIIYDNVESVNITKYIPNTDKNNLKIIITTQLEKWAFEILTLGTLKKEEAYEIVYEYLKKYINMDIKSSQKSDLIKKLVAKLEFYPLALRQVSFYIIEETKVGSTNPISDYIKEYKNISDNYMVLKEKSESIAEFADDKYLRTVFVSLIMTIKRMKRIDENAIDLLKICSYFNPEKITKRLLCQVTDEKSVNISLEVLQNYGLITYFNKDEVTIHRLVLDIVRQISQEEDFNSAYQKALSYILRFNCIIYHYYNLLIPREDINTYYILKYSNINLKIIESFFIQLTLENKSQLYLLLVYYGCEEAFKRIFEIIEELKTMNPELDFDPIGYIRQNITSNYILFNTMYEEEYSGPVNTIASYQGHLEILKYLIDKGASVHTQYKGRYLLHYATYNGHDNIVKYLIENEANINVKDVQQSTILYISADKGYDKIIEILTEEKVNINETNERGLSALHIAAQNGHTSVIEILLNKQAEVNLRDRKGRTPLYYAVMDGVKSSVQLLLSKDADVNQCDYNGNYPLHVAATHNSIISVELLLNNNCVVNLVNAEGKSPLHIAAKNGYTIIVALLLEKQAEINQTDHDGNTALHLASYYGHVQTVELLLNKLANVFITNKNGSSPLHLAAQMGETIICEILLKHGANAYVGDFSGRTAYHEATENGHIVTAQFLLDKQVQEKKVDHSRGTAV